MAKLTRVQRERLGDLIVHLQHLAWMTERAQAQENYAALRSFQLSEHHFIAHLREEFGVELPRVHMIEKKESP